MEGEWINFFNRLWRDSLCAIDSLVLKYWALCTGFCIGTCIAGWLGWLLAACCFCFLFPFPFSFHLISFHPLSSVMLLQNLRFQKGYTDRKKNGPKKVGPLLTTPFIIDLRGWAHFIHYSFTNRFSTLVKIIFFFMAYCLILKKVIAA